MLPQNISSFFCQVSTFP